MIHQHDDAGGHHHCHHHKGPQTYNRAFIIAIVANGLFVIAQIIFAHLSSSTSLLADAIHNLGDVLGLCMAFMASYWGQKLPTAKKTYGFKKTSILAALTNGLLLVFSCGIIATEAFYKFFSPTEVQALSVIVVASIGILVNGATAAMFIKGSNDLNVRAAYLHLLYDALISVGVVFSAIVLYFTGWNWIDPIVGLLIAFLILKGTWSLFTDSFHLIIDAVPTNISWQAVRQSLIEIPGVEEVHDLHIWAISTQENALSVHLFMPKEMLSDEARFELVKLLKEKHDIHHATIQVEQNLDFCEDACNPNLV